jgi:solute carrier family 25 protein 14/30
MNKPCIHSGLVCATATSPVDVIKSRYMQQQFSPTTGRGLVYSTPLNCFTQTISREGYQSLFKGWLPNWLRIGPHTIVTFVVYEQLRRLAGYSPI